jgi:hypothetical protein
MGSLTLPAAGTVYLDTDAIIYSVEKIDPYAVRRHRRAQCRSLWADTPACPYAMRAMVSSTTMRYIASAPDPSI